MYCVSPQSKRSTTAYVATCVSTDVKQNIPDWKDYLMKKLVGANTLPVDIYIKVK